MSKGIALPKSPKHDASATTSSSQISISDKAWSFYEEHCTYLPAMAGWFVFSALLSSYNKYVFGDDHLNFQCPLLMTSIHFLMQWMFSWTACALFPETLGTNRVRNMSWSEWLRISLPCGWITSGDVGLSNLSLVTISITFYTMVKASTPIFVLGWAYMFGIERITWGLVGVVAVIALGELLTVAGEVDFKLTGFCLCLTASMLSGARWTLVQLKLQTMEPPLKTTIVTMRLLAPSMFISMIAISVLIEHPIRTLLSNDALKAQLLELVALGALGGVIAVAMILCEFYLILHASAIILMIGGVIKEMITIFIGVSYFGDKLNFINLAGCGVVFCGVILYKVVFHLQKKESEHIKEYAESMENLLNTSSNDLDANAGSGDEDEVVFQHTRGVELLDRKASSKNRRKGLSERGTSTMSDDGPSDEEIIDA